MRHIDRKGLRAPARVLDFELASVSQTEEHSIAVKEYDTIWCLSRINGVPQEISFWDVTEDASIPISDLRHHLRTWKPADDAASFEPRPRNTDDLGATVVVCTRDRPAGLRTTLRPGRLPDDFPIYLLKAACRGLIEGEFMYVYESISDRRQSTSVPQMSVLRDVAHT